MSREGETRYPEDLQRIPVIVLTTSSAPDDVSDAHHSHANAYVTKPVNLEEFEKAVQSIDSFYLDTATRAPPAPPERAATPHPAPSRPPFNRPRAPATGPVPGRPG